MNKTDTSDLFRKITEENDQQAFKSLYDLFFPDMFRWAFFLTKSKETAEEIVHDALMALWMKRNEMSRVKDPKMYLFVCLKNKCLDHLRRSSRQVVRHIDDLRDFDITVHTDPEKLLITAEMIARVQKTIQQLPPRAKAVFILVKQYGLKYKEVAALLNISPRTVENQLAFAIRKISQTVRFLELSM